MKLLIGITFIFLFSTSLAQTENNCLNIINSSGKFIKTCKDSNLSKEEVMFTDHSKRWPKPEIVGYDYRTINWDFKGNVSGGIDHYGKMSGVCLNKVGRKEVFIRKGNNTYDVLTYCLYAGDRSQKHVDHLRSIFDSKAENYCKNKYFKRSNFRGDAKRHSKTAFNMGIWIGYPVGISYVCDLEKDPILVEAKILN